MASPPSTATRHPRGIYVKAEDALRDRPKPCIKGDDARRTGVHSGLGVNCVVGGESPSFHRSGHLIAYFVQFDAQ